MRCKVRFSFPSPPILIFKIDLWISRAIHDVPKPNPNVVKGVCVLDALPENAPILYQYGAFEQRLRPGEDVSRLFIIFLISDIFDTAK